MKVRLTTDRVHGGGLLERQGDVVDVSAAEGARLVATGQAEPVEVERAVARPSPETATSRQVRRPGA